jgi:predicted RNA-binding protein YlqC (UPF0109 family)
MEELVTYVVRGLVDHPDQVSVSVVEGEDSIMLELSVNADDVELVKGENGSTLQHLRAVVAAASGRRKAVVELLEGAAAASSDVGAAEE